MQKLFRLRLFSVCGLLVVMSFAYAGQSAAGQKQQVYNLEVPRAGGPGEMLVARVTAGPLKTHQRIIIRVRNGEIAGTVSPFGAQARQGSAVYTIPLPGDAVKDGTVRLLVEVEEKNAPTRAPTAEEVREITLAYIPATKSGGKQ